MTDELWARLEPLIPVRERRFRHPGRRRTPDRAALEGILFVARTGIIWNRLPTSMFGASGATCWGRLAEWHEAPLSSTADPARDSAGAPRPKPWTSYCATHTNNQVLH